MIIRRVIFIFCFFLARAAISAPAQHLESFDSYFKGSSTGQVQSRESEHFKVSWVNPKDEILIEPLLNHIESAHHDLMSVFLDSVQNKRKAPIEIFPDLKSFAEVSKLPIARFKAT